MAGVFVEIGSCDFDNLDALLKDGWTGYFIEPVHYHLSSLIRKISDDPKKLKNAVFELAAISDRNGLGMISYLPQKENYLEWTKGVSHIATNKRSAFTDNEAIVDYRDQFQTLAVPFMTLDSFIRKHNITEIDIMKVDVEGHELDIFNNYSWIIKPRHIKIEYTWVGLQPILDLLNGQGYNCTYDDEDVFARLR